MTNTRRTVILLGMIFAAAAISSLFPKPPQEQAKAESAKEANDPCRTTDKQHHAAGGLIQANGYSCATIKEMCFFRNLQEYLVTCERYQFKLEDHGGKWSVTPVDFP